MPFSSLVLKTWSVTVYFSEKRLSLLHPNTAQRSFFLLQSYSKKTLRKNVPKSTRKYKRKVLMPPAHPIILHKSNQFNMAAISVKRSIIVFIKELQCSMGFSTVTEISLILYILSFSLGWNWTVSWYERQEIVSSFSSCWRSAGSRPHEWGSGCVQTQHSGTTKVVVVIFNFFTPRLHYLWQDYLPLL